MRVGTKCLVKLSLIFLGRGKVSEYVLRCFERVITQLELKGYNVVAVVWLMKVVIGVRMLGVLFVV